jgi:hypothetical protein
MAKKETTANDPADQLGSMNIGETITFGDQTWHRVPGGWVLVIGSTSCFVPLSELAMAECGIEFDMK